MKNRKVVAWTLLGMWALLIFFFSSQVSSDSADLSSGVMNFINEILPFELNLIVVRKIAHFTEFLILGGLVLNVFSCYQKITARNMIQTSIICFLYACSDEIHQAFVPGRGPGIIDVGIDTLGSMVGILIYKELLKHKNKKKA